MRQISPTAVSEIFGETKKPQNEINKSNACNEFREKRAFIFYLFWVQGVAEQWRNIKWHRDQMEFITNQRNTLITVQRSRQSQQ